MPCEVGQVGELPGGRTAGVDDQHVQVPKGSVPCSREIRRRRYSTGRRPALRPHLSGSRGHALRVARADCDSRTLPHRTSATALPSPREPPITSARRPFKPEIHTLRLDAPCRHRVKERRDQLGRQAGSRRLVRSQDRRWPVARSIATLSYLASGPQHRGRQCNSGTHSKR